MSSSPLPASPAAILSEIPGAPGLDPDAIQLVRRCLSMLGVLSAGSMIGVTFSLYLVNHYPLLLIALSPVGRHLVLVAPTVDPIAFVMVGALRRLLFYAPCFLLGRSLGITGIDWLEARAGWAVRFVRWLQGLFVRAPRAAVLLLPGPSMSAIAGMSGMRLATFAGLASVGLLIRMMTVVAFGEWLRGPIEEVLAFIERIALPGTALMLTGVLIYRSWARRRRASC
jgi:hypothetical protein